MEKLSLIYFYIFIAFVLSNIPFLSMLFKKNDKLKGVLHIIGLVFALANTMIHESCHALAALLTGGKIKGISLFNNTSGVAETSSNSRISRIIVSYAGYTGSSLVSIGLFYFLFLGKYQWVIYFFIVLAVINWIFWIRNLYGFLWLTTFIVSMYLIIQKNLDNLLIHTSILLSSMVLVQSILSAFVILKLSIINKRDAGDASNLAKFTYIPAVFWGFLFFIQAIIAGYFIIRQYLII